MPLSLGLDLSTQSLTAVVLDTDAGTVRAEVSVSFGKDLPRYGAPSGFMPNLPGGAVMADPLMWVEALDLVFERLFAVGVGADEISALAGAGQQHGSVYLNATWPGRLRQLDPECALGPQLEGVFSRAGAPIWMDATTGVECEEITAAVGGPEAVNQRSGSIAIERFTGPQIRRFFKTEPQAYAETKRIHLVSSFLTSLLTGTDAPVDTGDGAGMNLLNLQTAAWDPDLLRATAPGLRAKLPDVVDARTVVGPVSAYWRKRYGFRQDAWAIAATGDNPSSLVGMGAARPGRIVVSLGTSDTLFAAVPGFVTDPRGCGHVFGNPLGGYMALICFKNGSLAREKIKDAHNLSWNDFDLSGLSRTPFGNDGDGMIPFFESEITPRTSGPVARYYGSEAFVADPRPPKVERACLEAQFANMFIHAEWLAAAPGVIYLTGGASQNDGLAQTLADIFQTRVERLSTPGSVGVGAAMRAAIVGFNADLDTLESRFCAPTPGRGLNPGPRTGEAARALIERFRSALGSYAR